MNFSSWLCVTGVGSWEWHCPGDEFLSHPTVLIQGKNILPKPGTFGFPGCSVQGQKEFPADPMLTSAGSLQVEP